MQSMLSTHEVAARYGISVNTVLRYRKLGIIPAPLMFGSQTLRWRAADLDKNDDWILRRTELRERGLDPDEAHEPQYSLPISNDRHQLAREHEAARHEPEPEDMTSDIDKIRTRIKTLKAQAVGLCVAAGKEIPDELINAEVK